MQIKQTLLKSGDRYQIVWLPIDRAVKEGTVISLRGDESKTKWTVLKQYEIINVKEPERFWGG